MGLTETSFKSRTPLQDHQAELGMDVIMQCDDTLKLNERRMELNEERDNLRAKRGIAIHNLYRIDKREHEIDTEEDLIDARIHQLEYAKKTNVKRINEITEETKSIVRRYEFKNCNVNIA